MRYFLKIFPYRPRRRRAGLWVVPVLVLLILSGCGRGEVRELTVVHTNDLHGHVLPARVEGWAGRTGGYATFVSWLNEVRRENAKKEIPTLLLDAGDFFMGTVEGNLTRGASVVRLMNLAGYDAVAVGNHEFDYGFFNLFRLTEEAEFPFLSANIFLRETDEHPEFIRPYLTREYGDLKVGIIGVTVAETPDLTTTGTVSRVEFREPAESIRPYLRRLRREGVDLLIVLSHLGLEGDRQLAEAFDDIDLIVGGHSHDLLTRPERTGRRPTLIVQAGAYGQFAGRLDLRIDPEKKRIVRHRSSIFANRQFSYPADLETNRLLAEIREEVGTEFDATVGIALKDITGNSKEQSPLGSLITDAMRSRADAEAAFQNAYGIRGSLFQGPVTRRDVYTVLPFDNSIVTMDLTGSQIRELLEQSLTLRKGLLQISGLRVEYSPDRPEGGRVISVEIGGDPLEDDLRYRIATNVFLAGGGDYFSTFTEGVNRRDSGVLLRDAVADYISHNTPLHPGFPDSRRWLAR